MDRIMIEEWIGRRVRIVRSPNPNLLGIEGEIANESLNAIEILQENGERKKVPKKGTSAIVPGSNERLELGRAVVRPEERSRKLYSKVMKK